MTTASVVTAFSVLERVAEHQPVGLSELARAADLPKSTVQRCLLTLQEIGGVESSGAAPTRWSMSLRALSVCGSAGARESLRDLALPIMSDLQLVTTETVHLCAPDGDVLGFAEKIGLWVEVGDTLAVTVGCDRRWTTCKERFGNEVNFRGFPHIPGSDYVLRHPRSGDAMDGRAVVP